MILHFHAETLPGEIEYINFCTDKETYNYNFYPESHYINVSRADLDAINKEIQFNSYDFSDDLTADTENAKLKLYYADLPDSLNDIMNNGINANDQGVVMLADNHNDAINLAITEKELFTLPELSLYVYTVNINTATNILYYPCTNEDENLKGIDFYGFSGNVPAYCIEPAYTEETLKDANADMPFC